MHNILSSVISFPLRETGPGEFEVRIPMDAPYFEGHFPGLAVLPGVVQIGIVLAALGEPELAEVVYLRLRQTVAPGDLLRLTLRERSGDVTFNMTRAGERVAHGNLRLG